MPSLLRLVSLLTVLLINCLPVVHAKPYDSWQDIIRNVPYYSSNGLAVNLISIRSWVLLSKGYCETPDRHILFDEKGTFIGWMANPDEPAQRQLKLNELRLSLYQEGRITSWLAGNANQMGYPFALSCDQPYVEIEAAIDRLLGSTADYRIWGTWDGLTAGSKETPVSLKETAELVWQYRQSQLNEPLDAIEFSLFLAQLLIESGANKLATSSVNAIGILQLRKEVLEDCAIPPKFWRHRMAQVDCAVRLYVLNRRNLAPLFAEVFGHLPQAKKNRLFSLLLVQTYHSGIGNMRELLAGETQGKAANYFARNHDNFSADDIALGLLFHNLGRGPWGWDSLYYLVDIELAEQSLCKRIAC